MLPPTLLPPLYPTAHLRRLLSRTLQTAMTYPEARHFLDAVSKREYSDYYTKIKSPMDLSKVLVAIRVGKCASRAALLDLLRLIAANCHAYCDLRFPTLPPLADKLVTAVQDYMRYAHTHKHLSTLHGLWANSTTLLRCMPH